ncbi:hypothetical protein RYH80_07435 [Halobaculum sp. MBLA0147]|uniref:hypothetical protein n=1 Tax=Halobaculum sp. MBLA0147 TaxID=3079934 RepID=UPI00352661D1
MSDDSLRLGDLPDDADPAAVADAVEARADRDPARIAVDVDRTLTTGEGDPWWEDGLGAEPDEHVLDVVDELYSRGHTIIVWTARPWRVADETVGWLTAHGVRYHGLRMEKGSSDVYLDDKAVNVERL